MMIDIAEKEYNIDIRKKLLVRTIQHYTTQTEESISFGCWLSGINRQVYYRKINTFHKKQCIADQVVDLVGQERRVQSKLGTRKLYFILKNKLRDLKVGRDKFF